MPSWAGRIAPEDVADVVPLAASNLAYTDANRLFEVNTRFRAASLLGARHQPNQDLAIEEAQGVEGLVLGGN